MEKGEKPIGKTEKLQQTNKCACNKLRTVRLTTAKKEENDK